MDPRFRELLEKSIEIWLSEDIGEGDHTTLSTIPPSAKGKAKLLSKHEGIIAGIFVVEKVIDKFDPELQIKILIPDGSAIKKGDIIFEMEGPVQSILQVERLCLNLLQRLSGVATQTRKYIKKIEGLKTKILDTRKTTPGLRFLEKEAVRLGGGLNHRAGLYDMILIKDNHIDFAGGIENAVRDATEYLRKNNLNLKIEVEARNMADVEKILNTGKVDRILLDNFSPELCAKAVLLIDRKAETESSGNITISTIREYAETGVDYISVGAITHQIKSLDLSLKAMTY